MKIGISAELIGTMAGGMETYDYNLINAILSIDNVNQYYIYTGHSHGLQELNDTHPNFSFRSFRTTSRWILIPFSIPWELLRRPVDVFHATFVPPLICPTKLVYTVHDIACLIHPEYFPPLVRYRLSKLISMGVKKAVKIIAVSEATKRDIVNTFGIDENRISVIYEGVNSSFRPIQDQKLIKQILQKYRINSNYILYVGRFHVRKNLIRLIQAFDIVRKETNSIPNLVLVGREHYYSTQVFQEIKRLNLKKYVICPGHVNDGDLPLLYNGAMLFVYPSLFEGFGLPPLEAMACGIPVISSNCTSLPEILGDAAVLVNPYDINEIADKMYQLISDESLRKVLIERGFSRIKMFSWEKTATETLKIYEEVYLTGLKNI